jgi:hypothetical protein
LICYIFTFLKIHGFLDNIFHSSVSKMLISAFINLTA